MNEITSITLENEMDLILAHKQSMRLADLAGLSIAGQTSFATAVSEISRSVIGNNKIVNLRLMVSGQKDNPKFISAVLEDDRKDFSPENDEGYQYARRLVSSISHEVKEGLNITRLKHRLPGITRIDDLILGKWHIHLNNDPTISPYEEIKRKNRELVAMGNRLRESEQRYQILTDSLPLHIMTLDDSGSITYANRWIVEYSGETIEELNANQWKNLIHPDDFKRAWSAWGNKLSETKTISVPETRLRYARTGEYRWHTGVIIGVTDDEEAVGSWNCFLVDIHAQKTIAQALEDNVLLKQTKAELENKVRLLNQSNQQLEQFAYVTSHDLQEPLRKILFYSDYLKQKIGPQLPSDATLFFDNLINASQRMRSLVQDVLAYSTIRNEGFGDVDLNEIVTEIVRELDFSIREKQALIKAGTLPVVTGNRRQLIQLFENLISNSLKYAHPDRTAEIRITAITDLSNIHISVSDNGIGFDNKFNDRIFNLFQRLHTKDKYGGTGIGLAICKKIVDLHHGLITVSANEGVGAVFTIILPVNPGQSHSIKGHDGTYISGR